MIGPKPGGSSFSGGLSSPGGGEPTGEDLQSMFGGTNSGGSSTGGRNSTGFGSTKPGGANSNKNPNASQQNIPGLDSSKNKSPGLISQPDASPREIGSFGEEVKRAVSDVGSEVRQFFSINTWLGIDPNKMDPEEEAKAKEVHARYQQLTQEQQAVAKKMYQEEMQKKEIEKKEEERKKQIEAQKKAQSVVMPSSPKRGAAGPGGKSRKKQAMHQLQQERTTIGTMQGE